MNFRIVSEFKELPSASRRYLLNQFLSACYFVWPIYILYMTSNYSFAAAGIFLSAAAIAQTASEIPTGYLADRFGQSKAIVFGQLLHLVAVLLLLGFKQEFTPLISGLMFGVGGAFVSGASDALIYQNVSHKDYEKTMHHNVSIFQAGLLLAAAIGGFLYTISPSLPFLVERLVMIGSTIPLLTLKEVYSSEHQANMKDAAKALKHLLSTKATLLYIVGFTWFYVIINLFIDIMLEARMIELAIVPSDRGLVIAGVKTLIFVLLQLFILRLVNSVAKKLYLSLFISVAIFPLLGLGNNVLVFIGLYFLINFTTVLSQAATSPIAQKLVSSKYRATELSLLSMCASAGYAGAAVAVSSYLGGHKTSGVFVIFAVGALLISTPTLIWSLRKYHQDVEKAQPTALSVLE